MTSYLIFQWLEENQFLESLIHIVCGTYEHEEIRPVTMTDHSERSPEQTEKGQQETSEKLEMNHKEGKEQNDPETGTVLNLNVIVLTEFLCYKVVFQ